MTTMIWITLIRKHNSQTLSVNLVAMPTVQKVVLVRHVTHGKWTTNWKMKRSVSKKRRELSWKLLSLSLKNRLQMQRPYLSSKTPRISSNKLMSIKIINKNLIRVFPKLQSKTRCWKIHYRSLMSRLHSWRRNWQYLTNLMWWPLRTSKQTFLNPRTK